MRNRFLGLVAGLALVVAAAIGPASTASAQGDTLINVGSPPAPFSANKQNEPAVAIDASHPNVLAAGANDNIDMEACNAGTDDDVSVHRGRRRLRRLFLVRLAAAPGRSRRTRADAPAAAPAPSATSEPPASRSGPIGTLPRILRERPGLRRRPGASRSDPCTADGGFSWANGVRLYYANLTSNFPSHAGVQGRRGHRGVAHRRTRGHRLTQDIVDDQDNWRAPVIASKQNSRPVLRQGAGLGRQRRVEPVLRQRIRLLRGVPGLERQRVHAAAAATCSPRRTAATPGPRSRSRPATNNIHSPNGFGRSGCTVRTDSHGVVYVFDVPVRRRHAGRGHDPDDQQSSTAAPRGAGPPTSKRRSTPATSSSRRSVAA